MTLPSQRPAAGEERPRLGRARRFACDGGELYALAHEDAKIARRLLDLGAVGVSGFVAAGEDDEGPWLFRASPEKRLDQLAPGERIPFDRALVLVRDLSRALATCEERGIFPGPLRPEEIAFAGDRGWILAQRLVAALLGEVTRGGSGRSAPSPRWTPPEQADGAPWDNAANRYVLGLVAYRLLSGATPFAGASIRDAAGAAREGPPPFADGLARTLRPGVQSLVLAMLAPERARRPASADAIARQCTALLEGGSLRLRVPSKERAAPARSPSPVVARRRLGLSLVPIAVGAVVLAVGLAGSMAAPEPAPARPSIRPREPIAEPNAKTCATCHPRQVAEWERSVMAYASRSPLFGALESAIEEQAGRDASCPNGAGVLRRAGADVCRDRRSSVTVTGAGGEHWCVNCHAAGDNLGSRVPAWDARGFASASRRPLRDLLGPAALEGISCAVCHQTTGPVHAASNGHAYEGNPTWTSTQTGALFAMRPEDARGRTGIANSGYLLDPSRFLREKLGAGGPSDPIVHQRATEETRAYARSSEACGACHDVRLFGTDAVGVRERGEHFKRLRNAYSEWRAWADGERAAGRRAATCQDCHMSLYPGVCVPSPAAARDGAECPPGFHFEARAPGELPRALVATSSSDVKPVTTHWFTSVDVPLARDYPAAWADDALVDASGVPMGLEKRRVQLLRHTFRFELGKATLAGARLEVPLEIENVGAGHRVPAGFSQEREIWVELTVTDARGRVVYEVGRVDGDDGDLRDKVMTRVTVDGGRQDALGRPLGVFGADVVDGPDVPRWIPDPARGTSAFRGRGLVNLQNGFYRCVRCVGHVDAEGKCQPTADQGRHRADRYADGDYDVDTGECRSNLTGGNALFETYFPIGSLDAERGVLKAPDAIIDTRSAPPRVPLRYTYELDASGATPPVRVRARLRFRAFPPFLLRAFAAYEAAQASAGARPSGPQLTTANSERNRIVDLAVVDVETGGGPR